MDAEGSSYKWYREKVQVKSRTHYFSCLCFSVVLLQNFNMHPERWYDNSSGGDYWGERDEFSLTTAWQPCKQRYLPKDHGSPLLKHIRHEVSTIEKLILGTELSERDLYLSTYFL